MAQEPLAYLAPPPQDLFASRLKHIQRRVIPTAREINNDIMLPSGKMQRPRMEETTLYASTYKDTFSQCDKRVPRTISPTRMHRPHPRKVHPFRKLDHQWVCHIKSSKHSPDMMQHGGIFSAEAGEKMQFKTSSQDAYKPHPANTQLSARRREPARSRVGIVPGTEEPTKRGQEDHWLPGCLQLTTNMTLHGPYQYLPRKRKAILLDNTAAGLCRQTSKVVSNMSRYHVKFQQKNNPDQLLTVRPSF